MKRPDTQYLGRGRVALVLCAERPGAHDVFVRNAEFVRTWLMERGYRVPAAIHARRGSKPPAAEAASPDAGSGEAFIAEKMGTGTHGENAGTLPQLYTDEALRSALALDPAPRVLITLGGTGLHPSDTTPRLTAELVDFEVPGIMHAIWKRGLENVDNAIMSRGTSGVAGRTFIVNLPSSKGGIRDGLAVLDTILHLIQAQIEDEPDQWSGLGSQWSGLGPR